MDIAQLQAYGYFTLTLIMVVVLYSYIYHLYTSKKKTGRDYEKYSNMALNDEVTDTPVEEKKKEEA